MGRHGGPGSDRGGPSGGSPGGRGGGGPSSGARGGPGDRQRGGDGQAATSAVLKNKEDKKADEEEDDEYTIPAVNRPEPTPWNVGAPAQPIQVAQPIMPPNLQDMVNNVYLNSMQRYQPHRFLPQRRF